MIKSAFEFEDVKLTNNNILNIVYYYYAIKFKKKTNKI